MSLALAGQHAECQAQMAAGTHWLHDNMAPWNNMGVLVALSFIHHLDACRNGRLPVQNSGATYTRLVAAVVLAIHTVPMA